MTRCVEFWRKWKKEPNFCGLAPQAISEIKAYLELVEKISKAGVPEEFIYENFPEGAARPLVRVSDDETRTNALNYVVACLKREERITAGDLKTHIDNLLGKEARCAVRSTHLRTEKPQVPVEKPAEPEPPQSLAESVRKDEVRQADTNQFRTGAQVKGGIAGEMFPAKQPLALEWSPATCKTGKCPDGKCHFVKQEILGDRCDLAGPIKDLTYCPIVERQNPGRGSDRIRPPGERLLGAPGNEIGGESVKKVSEMTRKDFERVPDRISWDSEVQCDSLVLLSMRQLHDSGFRCITVVACDGEEPICKVTTCSDVIHIEGIGGLGYQWLKKHGTVPEGVPPRQWDIDCLPKSGLFRLFSRSGIIAGSAISSFECWSKEDARS